MLAPPVARAGATSPRVEASSTTSCKRIVEFKPCIVQAGVELANTMANPVTPASDATRYKFEAS
jgi:hypothetical protein